MVVNRAGAQAAGPLWVCPPLRRFPGLVGCARRPHPPPCAGAGAARHFPRRDTRSRGSSCHAPAAPFLEPERTFLFWRPEFTLPGLRAEEELPPQTRPSHPSRTVRAPPSRNFSGDESGGRWLAALLTGSRLCPGLSASRRATHALGDTRGAEAGFRDGEGSQGRSFSLLSPQLPGLEKFSLRGKKKILSAARCPILGNVFLHHRGISSEPLAVGESPKSEMGGRGGGGYGVWVGARDSRLRACARCAVRGGRGGDFESPAPRCLRSQVGCKLTCLPGLQSSPHFQVSRSERCVMNPVRV